jgi:uncharacterized protein YprB with RNaseH-like and TPR domain
MYSKDQIKNMLFLDIETTSACDTIEEYNAQFPGVQGHWEKKLGYIRKDKAEYVDMEAGEVYQLDSALYPEFGKVIVVSIGQVVFDDFDKPQFKVKSFYGDNEKDVLEQLMAALSALFRRAPGLKLVGHNVKGFDAPFLIRRSLINKVTVPPQLHLQNVKPWENCLLDTAEIWKFGSWNGASLALICDLLGIPSPKENMYGGEVARAYWQGRLEEIKDYCEGDVRATANVILSMGQYELV